MNYEIVELKEKTVVGISARTNNNSPEMHNVIGGLWNDFYGKGIYTCIPCKVNGKAIEIYADYEDDENADYTAMVACEVENADDLPEGTEKRIIPAGKYAKFVVRGNMVTACIEFWRELWNMDLPRSFVCDFEEYQNSDPDNSEIHMYIGLNIQ